MADFRRTFIKFLGFFEAMRVINDRYKHPRLKMTKLVKISLLALRLYLVFMIGLLLYKFILISMGKG